MASAKILTDKQTNRQTDKQTNRQTDKQTDRQHYPVVDLLKYICALLVVSIHIAPLSSFFEVIPLTKYLNYGIQNYIARLAVPFYFAAAGFFLFRKIDFNNFDISITKNYIIKLLRLLGVWTVLLFVGGTVHLWYMGGLVVAVCVLSVLLCKQVSLKKMIVIALFLYIFGLLGDPYFGLFKILQNYKAVKYATKAYFVIFGTTRNGLFMGFPFLLLGGVIEKKKVSMKPLYAAVGFILSMLLLLCEAVLIKKYDLPKDVNMYFFLVPAIFFLLVFAVNVRVQQGGIFFRILRNISIIVYFSHMFVYQWIAWGWKAVDRLFGINFDNSLINYLLTVVIATILGILIDRISKKEKWSFLKYLYA